MTKQNTQNPYKIGAASDKPNNSQRRDKFSSNRNQRGNSRGGMRGGSRGSFRGNSRGDSRGSSRGSFRGNNRSDRGNDRNDRGTSRGMRGNDRGMRGGNRGMRGGSNRNYRGDDRSNSRDFSRNNDRRDFNKTRPIRKQYNPRRQNDQRRDERPYRSQNQDNRKPQHKRQDKPLKHEQAQNKEQRQVNEEKVQTSTKVQKVDDKVNKVEDGKTKTKPQKIKHNRVIVRNLVFDINESHLRKLLSPFGEIEDIHIPMNPDNKGSRGFAFIEFKNRNNALKAIKQLNGTKFKGRQIVLDESVSKQRYLQSKIDEEEKVGQQNKVEEQDAKIKIQEGKKQKNEMKAEDEQENDQEEEKDDDQEDVQEQELSNDEEDQVKVQTFKGKRQKTDEEILEDISSQVFIRNLPINVDEKSLHQFFRKYGKLKFAKVVINKQTGLSKGSAFLKFDDAVKAKELVEYSRNYEMNLLGKNPNFKINPAINLQLEGIVLKLFPVQSRTNISDKLKGRQELDAKREQDRKAEEKKKKPIKKIRSIEKLVEYDPNNKRNLKLALLGINQITEDMREKDQQRFRNHEKEKVQKLKNPNNSVSDKRVVLKYLSKEITEQEIRALCQEYLQESKHKGHDLTYCKLMLESLETKKSAGFAFVEFKTHEIALGFLEWIAEQPKKLMNEPFICEFAIQDSRKLQKLLNKNNRPNQPTKNEKPKSKSKSKKK